MTFPSITSPAGVLAALAAIPAFFYWFEQRSGWRLFTYLPPLVFIYAVPMVLTNLGVLPAESPVYLAMGDIVLPMMLTLMLLNLDVFGAIRTLGRGLVVMLFGSLGVVVGAIVSMLIVGRWLDENAWKAYGALAGSWTGGTGNLAAVSQMLEAGDEKGLAVLADATIYTLWLPVLLGSKKLTGWFSRFTRADQRPQIEMQAAADEYAAQAVPKSRDYLYLLAIGLGVAAIALPTSVWLAQFTPPELSASTIRILLITTVSIILSLTPLRTIPGSRELSMALLMIFFAQMGATAKLGSVAHQAVPFLIGAVIWISIHGLFCLLGARLMRVNLGIAAIASAANIGGAASSPIVAAHHNRELIPASILMALVGYAIGNYAGLLTASLCRKFYAFL